MKFFIDHQDEIYNMDRVIKISVHKEKENSESAYFKILFDHPWGVRELQTDCVKADWSTMSPIETFYYIFVCNFNDL